MNMKSMRNKTEKSQKHKTNKKKQRQNNRETTFTHQRKRKLQRNGIKTMMKICCLR